MASKSFRIAIFQEFNWWVAQCLDLDVATQGGSREEAIENIAEALRLLHEQVPESGTTALFPPSIELLPAAPYEEASIEI